MPISHAPAAAHSLHRYVVPSAMLATPVAGRCTRSRLGVGRRPRQSARGLWNHLGLDVLPLFSRSGLLHRQPDRPYLSLPGYPGQLHGIPPHRSVSTRPIVPRDATPSPTHELFTELQSKLRAASIREYEFLTIVV